MLSLLFQEMFGIQDKSPWDILYVTTYKLLFYRFELVLRVNVLFILEVVHLFFITWVHHKSIRRVLVLLLTLNDRCWSTVLRTLSRRQRTTPLVWISELWAERSRGANDTINTISCCKTFSTLSCEKSNLKLIHFILFSGFIKS